MRSSHMRSSLRSHFSARGFTTPEPLVTVLLCLVYLVVMMIFAGDVRRKFGLHPVITVTVPLLVLLGAGWLSLHGARWFKKERKRLTTGSRRMSPTGVSLRLLGILLLLAGLAVLTVEGVIVLVRMLA